MSFSLKLTPEVVACLTQERFAVSTYSYASYLNSDPAVQQSFLADARARFDAHRADPEPVTVMVSEFHAPHLHRNPGAFVAWKVLCEGDAVVFFDEDTSVFGKATYVDNGDGGTHLLDLGLRADDPFEIFLA